jgi:mannosyltransferase OCH1-like enzyme
MGKDHPLYGHYYDKALKDPQTNNILDPLRKLYTENINGLQSNSSNSCLIPKKIHQIWLGSTVPEKFLRYMATWKKLHPEWEYILWDDHKIAQLHLENRDIYNRAINYAERSDIARYEILYRFGGLYVDTDCECLKSFDELHQNYDFYAGIELPALAPWLGMIIFPNAIIGSAPRHPIMLECITEIRKRASIQSHDIVLKTGPILFTYAAQKHLGNSSYKNIILPASYFYPIDKETKDRTQIMHTIQPETLAIHHWAGSWILKEEAFVPGIKIKSEIKNGIIRFTICDER